MYILKEYLIATCDLENGTISLSDTLIPIDARVLEVQLRDNKVLVTVLVKGGKSTLRGYRWKFKIVTLEQEVSTEAKVHGKIVVCNKDHWVFSE